MASRTLDEFENDWTFVDKDGKVDVEVSLRLVRISFTLNFPQKCSGFARVLREARHIVWRILFRPLINL